MKNYIVFSKLFNNNLQNVRLNKNISQKPNYLHAHQPYQQRNPSLPRTRQEGFAIPLSTSAGISLLKVFGLSPSLSSFLSSAAQATAAISATTNSTFILSANCTREPRNAQTPDFFGDWCRNCRRRVLQPPGSPPAGGSAIR